jgi:hypothetical protein
MSYRVLVAGTADLMEMARRNVRFDESRMFEFLHALEGIPAARGVPIACCRLGPRPLAPRTRAAAELALQALGVDSFVDVALLRKQHGAPLAEETVRTTLIAHLL